MRQDEIAWSGVLDWLDAQDGPVSREDLIAYLRANEVQVHEVVKGKGGRGGAGQSRIGIDRRSEFAALAYRLVDAEGTSQARFATREEAEAARVRYEADGWGPFTVREQRDELKREAVHAMDITPSMRETALREGFPLFQAGRRGEPVARLTGLELGDFGDDLKARMAAARQVYRGLQAGPPAQHPALGEIRFTRAGWNKLRTTGADVRQWQMVPALREIVERAEVMKVEPLRKPRADGIVRFYWLEADIALAGSHLRVGVHIGEDGAGRKFYNLNQDLDAWRARYEAPDDPRTIKAGRREPRGGDGSPLEQGNVPPADDLNITLLGEAGEKRPREARAAIELGESLARLWVGPKADGTSLIHEHGHAFVHWLRWAALREQATDAAKRDWGVIRDWLGATDDAPLTKTQHEQFASAFERYTAEGKAPSIELVPIFERFKRWMIEVYQTVQAISPDIPVPVRNVMDRMLASDEQIARARMENHGPPPPHAFEQAPDLRTGPKTAADEVESLAQDLATSDDYEIRLAQIEAAGRLSPEDQALLKEAGELASRAELYAKAYQAAAACMA